MYNCAEFLRQALDSILYQLGGEDEVIVFDGGSTDGTATLMAAYQDASPQVRYHQAVARGGIDADMAACVGLARGDYCWLFSGDDVMRPDGVARALEQTQSGHDLYVCEHTLCDIGMRVLANYPVLSPNLPFDAQLSEPGGRGEWFRRAASSEAFFSFMSGLIVRRAKWNEGRLVPEFIGSCWAHVARLFELMEGGLRVAYLPQPYLDQRGGNDSFRERGLIQRYRLAVEGFHRLADRFFPGDSPEGFHIRRVIRAEFQLKMFLNAKLLAARDGRHNELPILNDIVRRTYRDNTLDGRLKKAVYATAPLWAIRAAIRVWWWFHRKLGQA